MPTKTRKVLVARLGNRSPVQITEVQWRHIEKAYKPLVPQVRNAIEAAITNFLAGATHEETAASRADAGKVLGRIQSTIKCLLDLVTPHTANIDGNWYALHLLRNSLRNDPVDPDGSSYFIDPIDAFSELLVRWISACNDSQKELDDPDYSISKGDAWDRWIRSLTEILGSHKLPTKVRKDSDKHVGSPSPFVALVRELQKLVPKKYHRHGMSDGALAQAIYTARGRTRTNG